MLETTRLFFQNMAKAPSVSILIPIYGRPEFHRHCIKNVLRQEWRGKPYPKKKLEIVIVDDSPEGEEIGPYLDEFKDKLPTVNYVRLEKKITLGAKRNMLNDLAKGEMLCAMDGDDLYCSRRLEVALVALMQNPQYMMAGASEMHLFFENKDKIYKFGPYDKHFGPNHCTNATFTYRRELLKHCRYDDTAERAEESAFTKHYTIPVAQLDPMTQILVATHATNTFEKSQLLGYEDTEIVKATDLKISDFVDGPDGVEWLRILKSKKLSLMKFVFSITYTKDTLKQSSETLTTLINQNIKPEMVIVNVDDTLTDSDIPNVIKNTRCVYVNKTQLTNNGTSALLPVLKLFPQKDLNIILAKPHCTYPKFLTKQLGQHIRKSDHEHVALCTNGCIYDADFECLEQLSRPSTVAFSTSEMLCVNSKMFQKDFDDHVLKVKPPQDVDYDSFVASTYMFKKWLPQMKIMLSDEDKIEGLQNYTPVMERTQRAITPYIQNIYKTR